MQVLLMRWQGTVSFTGGNNQTITGNPDETFYNLTVNKSGGNVQPITGSLLTITNNLLISNGTLDLGNNITTLQCWRHCHCQWYIDL